MPNMIRLANLNSKSQLKPVPETKLSTSQDRIEEL